MKNPLPAAFQTPPHSKEDEAYLVAVMMSYPDEIDEILTQITEEHFYWDCHQKLFRVVKKLRAANQPVDPNTVLVSLKDIGEFENIGGSDYLVEILTNISSTSAIEFSIKRIKAFAIRRQLIRICTEAISDAYTPRPIEELLPELEHRLQNIGNDQCTSRLIPVSESLKNDAERLQRVRSGNADEAPIPSGLGDLDMALSGGFRTGVTAIGARPGSGKTAIGKQICRYVSKELGIPSLFVSLEMPDEQLIQRDMAGLMKMDIRRYRDGCAYWTGSEDALYDKMYMEYQTAPAYIIDEGYMTVSMLSSILRRAVNKHGVKIMVIDYLTLLQPDHETRYLSRREQVEYMTRQIKLMSRQHSMPIIQLCQLNRDGEEKPSLRDFRDSGSIEQDADNCLMLWQKYNVKQDPIAHIGCHVAKQRNGMSGMEIDLKFYKPSATFYDWNSHE